MKKFSSFLFEDTTHVGKWWKELTRLQQDSYLKLHPGSTYKNKIKNAYQSALKNHTSGKDYEAAVDYLTHNPKGTNTLHAVLVNHNGYTNTEADMVVQAAAKEAASKQAAPEEVKPWTPQQLEIVYDTFILPYMKMHGLKGMEDFPKILDILKSALPNVEDFHQRLAKMIPDIKARILKDFPDGHVVKAMDPGAALAMAIKMTKDGETVQSVEYSLKANNVGAVHISDIMDRIRYMKSDKQIETLLKDAKEKLTPLMETLNQSPLDADALDAYINARRTIMNDLHMAEFKQKMPLIQEFPDEFNYYRKYTQDLYDAEFNHIDVRTAANALNKYKGGDYRGINQQLRFGIDNGEDDTIDELDKVFDVFQLKTPAVLMRGASFEPDMLKKIEIGGEISDKAYVSTSLRKSTAIGFSTNVMFKIKAPKGTPVVPLNTAAIPPKDELNNSECEFLFHRDSRFLVTKMETSDGRQIKSADEANGEMVHITMEYLLDN